MSKFTPTAPLPPTTRHPRGRRTRDILVITGAGIIIGGAGIGIGSANAHTITVTKTVTVTTTTRIPVPGPTTTVTVVAPAPQPGGVIGRYSGTGSEVTPAFNVPADGNYTVTWSYSGNTDPSAGIPSNFIVNDNSGGYGQLPNDIASSGNGSTEVTGAGATSSLNVKANGSWTLTVRAA